MQESYSVTQNLSFLEYVGLSLSMLPKHKLIKRLLIFISCVSILSAVLSLVAPGPREVVTASSLIIQATGPVLVIILFFFVSTLILGAIMVKLKPEILKGVTFTFTHWGMERVGAKSEISIPWKDFQDVKETKRFILLFVKEKNRNNIYAIKKASLDSPVFEDELIKFIDKNRPL